ncbi:MAG TPA: YaiI/YqxD family protein [Candidatus Fimivicinus intestinavium]|nr:YaiI/YqxD family protein [Candidatus Fimivicinus intestinavium]
MQVLIDADGCPVVDCAIRVARRFGLPVLLLCDTSHVFSRPGAQTVTVSKGADSADFALVNLLRPGDAAVTQDYGLAAMCLARGAFPIHQDGWRYTPENIDALLLARHTAKKLRRAGGRLKGPSKRTAEQDQAFEQAFIQLLEFLTRGGSHPDADPV